MSVHAALAVSSDIIDNAFFDVHDELNQRPTVPQQLNPLVAWFSSIVSSLLIACEGLLRQVLGRLDALELAAQQAPQPTAPPQPAPSAAAASVPPGMRLRRCTLCHARGHTQPDCRTANPSEMRKRVQRNATIAKQSRAFSAQALAAAAPLPTPFPLSTTSLAPAAPMAYAALAADATELRRRSAQSRRDKRASAARRSSTS